MAEQGWEYKTVKVKANNRRHQDKVLNKHSQDGWELVEIQRGPLFRGHDNAVLRRPK